MGQLTQTHIDVNEVKLAATGRWREILVSVGGLASEKLSGRHCPCPKCGGIDRFRAIDTKQGVLFCNKCFSNANGDGLAAVRWLLDLDFPEALNLVADHLGITGKNPNNSPKPIDLIGRLATVKCCPRASLIEYGAVIDADAVCFPVFDGNRQKCSEFRIWPTAPNGSKQAKGLLAKGRPSGLFFPMTDGGATHFPTAGERWCITEGVKDSAALHGLEYLAAGMNGDALPQKFVGLFQGCDVVIIPDRTTDAETKAEETAARLAGVAKSVKIATLPLPLDGDRGDDTRDALKQRDGEQLVRQCIEAARPWNTKPGCEVKLTTMRSVTQARLADHRKGPVPRIATGIPALDRTLEGGFDLGTMIVVAALSSHGKSAFALQTGHFVTTQLKMPALFVSIEMSLPQLADRTFSHISDAPKANWHRLIERLEEDSKRHFEGSEEFYLVGGIVTLEEVEAAIRTAFEKGAKIAFIDYAQKISTGNRDDMNAAMSKVSARMTALASEYNAVVVVLAQLNKRVTSREDFTPQMHDVYYGTSLTNDADYILFNVWPFKIDKKNPFENYLVLVGKNRNGDAGVGIQCKFNAPRQKITQRTPEATPEEAFEGSSQQSFGDWSEQQEGGFYE